MNRHFQDELDRLRLKLLEMSFLTDEAVERACESLFTRNADLARGVIRKDKSINALEIEIDERGHSLLALGQPLAAELRLVTAILKINTGLERVGDHAVNVAEKSLCILKEPPAQIAIPLRKMANAVQQMLREAIDSFLNRDSAMAQNVLKCDDRVDAYNDALVKDISSFLTQEPKAAAAGISLILICHNLERIGDLANNIAEDVIYLTQAKEVRHRIHLKGDRCEEFPK